MQNNQLLIKTPVELKENSNECGLSYLTGISFLFSSLQIRPNAVALVDAFDHTDNYLGSALGRYDGDVYTHLYKGAWKEPLNDNVVTEGYQEYLRPVLTQQLWEARSKL